MKYPSRQAAADIITQFDVTHQQLKKVQHEAYKKLRPKPGSWNRTMVLTNDVIRLKGRLDHILEHVSGKRMNHFQPDLRSILRIGCYELLFDDHIPDFAAIHSSVDLTKESINKKAAGLINAVLRKILRQHENDPNWLNKLSKQHQWLSFPAWLIKKWEKRYGKEDAIKLCNTFNHPVPMFLRVNQTRMSMDNVVKSLAEDSIVVEQFKPIPSFLRVLKWKKHVLMTPLFTSGVISIQDPASAAIIYLLEPKIGETVLDVCAAPGTKSLMIAEMIGSDGTVLSSDKDYRRVEMGKLDIKRHKLKNIHWSVLDAMEDHFPISRKILIDAPCTGTGVIGRRPDIRWRRRPGDVVAMAGLQFSILNHISRYLLSGGTMVYSTCSLEPEENCEVVERFLNSNRGFKLVPPNSNIPKKWVSENGFLMTSPVHHGTDGMFAAKLLKI